MRNKRSVGVAIAATAAVVGATGVAILPVAAFTPDIVITQANDVDIIAVELVDDGTPVSQPTEVTRVDPGRVTDFSDDTVTFSTITIDDGAGGSLVLDEFNVSAVQVANLNFPAGSSGVYAFENGVITDVSDPGFEDALNRAVSSLDLRDYIGYDTVSTEVSGNAGHDFDIVFEAPLRNSDYLLVAERNGNTDFDLAALDKQGNVIGTANIVGFDQSYGWNTGYAPSNQTGQPMFFTVADISVFGVDTEDDPIYGFRIDNNGEADVKFFGLAPDPFLPGITLDKTVYEGHDSGASCGTSGELVTVANGADITFCFEITNSGEADLEDLTIDDADLGLTTVPADDTATFTVLSGDLPLVAGEVMTIAYETTSTGAVLNTATASAIAILSTGGVNPVVTPEQATDTAEVAVPAAASISGSVVDDNGDPIPGVTITLSGGASATTTTDASGDYTFAGLAPGTYTVTETQPAAYDDGPDTAGTIGGVPTGDASVNDVISGIALAAGEDSIDNDFAEVIRPGSISGSVVDQNGDPIAGVTVTLSGDASATTSTDAAGNYSFTGLTPGTYTVTETTPPGMADGGETAGSLGGTVTDDQVAGIVIGSGDASVDNDFDEALASIAGTVVDQDGTGIPGVTITLSGTDPSGAVAATATTDANGDYLFTGLLAGTYTVTETTPAGYDDGGETAGSTGGTVSDDVIADITLPAGVASVDNDFDEVLPSPASISGTVVDDLGRPIAGVTVTLGGDRSATTITDADGNYSFTGLPPGTYTVAESQPIGYGDGADTAGSAGGTVTNDLITGIVLVSGQNSTDNDFAETTASIAGTVTDDVGAGIADVTITLTGTDGNGQPVSTTTTTDANGDYEFDGLLAGTYTVTETQPAAYGDGPDSAGSTGGTVGNDVISDIALGAGVASADNDFNEVRQVPVPEDLPDTGAESSLIVAYGLLLVVGGAILTLTANELRRRRF